MLRSIYELHFLKVERQILVETFCCHFKMSYCEFITNYFLSSLQGKEHFKNKIICRNSWVWKNTITEMLRSNCVSAREHYNTTTQCTLLLKGGEEKAT